MDDLYLVRMRAGPGSKGAFHAAVEHVGTRERHHFDSARDLIAFFELRCVARPDEPPLALDQDR